MYSVTFPAGSMGLELEPVIVSSERQIGCRVKEFYFALDHDGISESNLRRLVKIGDVICYVNEKNVLSSKFDDILELLRTLKPNNRMITFKDISIKQFESSSSSSGVVVHQNAQPSRKIPQMKAEKENLSHSAVSPRKEARSRSALTPTRSDKLNLQSPVAQSAVDGGHSRFISKVLSPSPLMSSTSAVDKEYSKVSRDGPAELVSKAAGAKRAYPGGIGIHTTSYLDNPEAAPSIILRALSTPSGKGSTELLEEHFDSQATPLAKLHRSPLQKDISNGRHHLAQPTSKMDSHSHRGVFSPPTHKNNYSSASESMAMILSPKAVKEMAQSKRGATAVNPGRDGALALPKQTLSLAAIRARLLLPDAITAHIPAVPPEVKRLIGSMGETLGSGLIEVGSVVVNHAADAAIAVGTSVGDQAEKVVIETARQAPVYSSWEVQGMMASKNALLQELSQTVMQLGVAEEKQQTLEKFSQQLQHRELDLLEQARLDERQIAALQAEVESLLSDRDRRDAALLEQQQLSEADIEEWREVARDYMTRFESAAASEKSLREALAAIEASLEDERASRVADQNTYRLKLENIETEQAATRVEMTSALQRAVQQIEALERERDSAMAEAEVLRDVSVSVKAQTESEHARIRENMVTQQEWHRVRLVEREEEVHTVRKELVESQQAHEVIKKTLGDCRTECESLHKRCSHEEQRAADLQAVVELLERQLTAAQSQLQQAEEKVTGALHEADCYREAGSTETLRVQELEQRLADSVVKVCNLEEQLAEQDYLLASKSMVTEALQAVEERHSKEMAEQKERIQDLARDLRLAEASRVGLLDKLHTLSTISEEDSSALQGTIDTLREECHRLEELHAADLLAQRERDTEIVMYEAEVSRQSQLLNSCQDELTECKVFNAHLEDRHKLDTDALARVSNMLENEKDERMRSESELRGESARMRELTVALRQALATVETEKDQCVAEKEQSQRERHAELQRYMADLQDIQKLEKAAKEDAARSSAVAQQRHHHVRVVRSSCAGLLKCVDSLRGDLGQLKGEYDELLGLHVSMQRMFTNDNLDRCKAADAAQHELERLRSQLIEAAREKADVAALAEAAEMELVAASKRCEDLFRGKEEAQLSISSLRSDFNSAVAALEVAHANLQASAVTQTGLEQQLSSVKDENSSLQKRLIADSEEWQSKLQVVQDESKSDLADRDAEIVQLRKQFQDIEERNRQLRKECCDSEAMQQRAELKGSSLESELDSLRELFNNTCKSHAQSLAQLSAKVNDDISAELSAQFSAQFQVQLREKDRQLTAVMVDIEALQRELQTLREAFAAKDSATQKLQQMHAMELTMKNTELRAMEETLASVAKSKTTAEQQRDIVEVGLEESLKCLTQEAAASALAQQEISLCLQREKESLEIRLSDLSQKLAVADEEHAGLLSVCMEKEAELRQGLRELEGAEVKCAALEAELLGQRESSVKREKLSQTALETLEAEAAAAKQAMADMENELRRAVLDIACLQSKLSATQQIDAANTEATVAALQSQLTAANDRVLSLEGALSAAAHSQESTIKEIVQQSEDIQKLQTVNAELQAQCAMQADELAAEQERARNAVEEEQSLRHRDQEAMAGLREEMESLSRNLSAAEAERNSLCERLQLQELQHSATVTELSNSHESSVAQLQSSLKTATGALEESVRNCDKYEASIHADRLRLQESDSCIADLKHKLAVFTSSADTSDQLRDALADLAVARANASTLRIENLMLKNSRGQSEAELERTRTAKADAEESVCKLQEQLSTLQSESVVLKGRVAGTDATAAVLIAKLEETQLRGAAADATVSKLRQELNDVHNALTAAREAALASSVQLQRLQDELDSERMQLKRLITESAAMKDEEKVQRSLQKQEEEVLRSQLAEIKQQHLEALHDLSEAHGRIATLNASIQTHADAAAIASEATTGLESLTQEVALLKLTLIEREAAIVQVAKLRDELAEVVQSFPSQLQASEMQLHDAVLRADTAQARIDSLQTAAEQMEVAHRQQSTVLLAELSSMRRACEEAVQGKQADAATLAEYASKEAALVEQIRDLRAIADRHRTETAAASSLLQQETAAALAKTEHLEERIVQLEGQITDLRGDREEFGQIAASLAAVQADLCRVSEDRDQSAASLAAVQADLCRVSEDRDQSVASLAAVQADLCRVSEDRDQLYAAISRLTAQETSARQDLQAMLVQLAGAVKSKDAAAAEAASLQKDLDAALLEKERHALESQETVTALNRRIDELMDQIGDSRTSVIVAQREKEATELTLQATQKDLRASSDSLSAFLAESSALREKAAAISERENYIASLEDRLQTASAEQAALETLAMGLQAKIQELELINSSHGPASQHQLASLKAELVKSAAEIHTLRSREVDIMSVLAAQSTALSEAEKREEEHSSARRRLEILLVERERLCRDVAEKAIHSETTAVRRVHEVEAQLQEVLHTLGSVADDSKLTHQALDRTKSEYLQVTKKIKELLLSPVNTVRKSSLTNGHLNGDVQGVKGIVSQRNIRFQEEAEDDKENSATGQHILSAPGAPSPSVLRDVTNEHVSPTAGGALYHNTAAVDDDVQEDIAAWHDQLVCLTLDLHEALTFALVELTANYPPYYDSAPPGGRVGEADFILDGDGAALRYPPSMYAVSNSLHSLHKHTIRAPWMDLTQPLQTIMPAHVLLMSRISPFHSPQVTPSKIAKMPNKENSPSTEVKAAVFDAVHRSEHELQQRRSMRGDLSTPLCDIVDSAVYSVGSPLLPPSAIIPSKYLAHNVAALVQQIKSPAKSAAAEMEIDLHLRDILHSCELLHRQLHSAATRSEIAQWKTRQQLLHQKRCEATVGKAAVKLLLGAWRRSRLAFDDLVTVRSLDFFPPTLNPPARSSPSAATSTQYGRPLDFTSSEWASTRTAPASTSPSSGGPTVIVTGARAIAAFDPAAYGIDQRIEEPFRLGFMSKDRVYMQESEHSSSIQPRSLSYLPAPLPAPLPYSSMPSLHPASSSPPRSSPAERVDEEIYRGDSQRGGDSDDFLTSPARLVGSRGHKTTESQREPEQLSQSLISNTSCFIPDESFNTHASADSFWNVSGSDSDVDDSVDEVREVLSLRRTAVTSQRGNNV